MNSQLPFGAATAMAVISALLRLAPPLQQSARDLPAMLDLDCPDLSVHVSPLEVTPTPLEQTGDGKLGCLPGLGRSWHRA